MQVDANLSTGLPGLDQALKGLIPGDNIVWHVEAVGDYQRFVLPFAENAARQGRPLVYFRFAEHEPLLPAEAGAQVLPLRPSEGFETFLSHIHRVVEINGREAAYVFDCMSGLAAEWYSDQMLSNFFLLTCPYIYDVGSVAYFAVLREVHSFQATATIADTAQVLINVYPHKGRIYIHPWKVQARYSPSMHMLHAWEGQQFRPITESAVISEILTSVPWVRLESSADRRGIWNQTFGQAGEVHEAVRRGEAGAEQARPCFQRLLRMAVSRDERVLALAEKHLTLQDLLNVGKRMIGTGLIGGKSVGMLLARAILRANQPRWGELLEPHDSFFIGSDVFYTYLVRNGLWWAREKQKDPGSFLEGAEQARQRMLVGSFPDYIYRQFEDMLDYFGQSPIIVRSSSLLEDNFGNAFAGKYESVFCANQGPRQERLEDFLSAVRTIYASAMSVRALTYRAQRGLLDRDEQMALLVQRVSGAMYGRNLYYPEIAGVGFSFNPYVWSRQIDPEAGMIRLVFGLGTRAVDRSDDDYTRVVALNAPERRPEANFDEVRQYSQRKVDVLDLEANQLVSLSFPQVVSRSPRVPVNLFASSGGNGGPGGTAERGVLTFERLFAQTPFVRDMREMLAVLQQAYDYPVDVEFTANFLEEGKYTINLLQCRPLQVRGGGTIVNPPADIAEEDLLLDARGAVIGQSRLSQVDRIIYVVPSAYAALPIAERHGLARLIGRLTHLEDAAERTVLLIGPGRWGTATPSLGVPVQFADINTVSILCEIVAMREGLVPDVSLGTHFFSELVELDILYFAAFPSRQDNRLNASMLESWPNRLAELLPEAERWSQAVRVIDVFEAAGAKALKLNANALTQRVVCYLQGQEAPLISRGGERGRRPAP